MMLDGNHKSSCQSGVKRVPLAKRVQILSILCKSRSTRSISRIADVSINTVAKLLSDAGEACAMAAGISDRLWSMEDIAALIDADEAPANKRGPFRKQAKA